jgi:hypothetical protein
MTVQNFEGWLCLLSGSLQYLHSSPDPSYFWCPARIPVMRITSHVCTNVPYRPRLRRHQQSACVTTRAPTDINRNETARDIDRTHTAHLPASIVSRARMMSHLHLRGGFGDINVPGWSRAFPPPPHCPLSRTVPLYTAIPPSGCDCMRHG